MPQIQMSEQERDEQQGQEQEPFIRQVEDHSLPAEEVLNDPQEDLGPSEARPLFIP